MMHIAIHRTPHADCRTEVDRGYVNCTAGNEISFDVQYRERGPIYELDQDLEFIPQVLHAKTMSSRYEFLAGWCLE